MPLKSIPFAEAIKFTRSSDAYIYNSKGVFEKVARDLPRFNYHPITKVLQGIQIEEGRTNLMPSSNAENTLTILTRATYVESGGQKFIDGVSPMRLLREDSTAAASHFAVPVNAQLSAASFYTGSFFVKAAGRSRIELTATGVTGWIPVSPRVRFNLAAGTFEAFGGAIGAMEKVSADIWRVSITAKTGSAVLSSTFYPILMNDNDETVYNGDGSSGVFIGGAQLELGEFVTSHIPTTGAQASRSSDTPLVENVRRWFGVSGSTFYAEFTPGNVGIGGTNLAFYARSKEFPSNSLVVIRRDRSGSVLSLTSDPVGLPTSVADPAGAVEGARLKAAAASDKGGISISVNGRPALSSAPTAQRPLPDIMFIGQTGANSQCVNGHIRSITHYARKMTSAELVGITS